MSSPAMEKEGLVRGLKKLKELGITIKGLVTDQHAGITKMMREDFTEMDHWYDTWHVVKG